MKPDACKFTIGQIVYSVISSELTGQITGILFRQNGVSYLVAWSNNLEEKYHNEIELTAEKVFNVGDKENAK